MKCHALFYFVKARKRVSTRQGGWRRLARGFANHTEKNQRLDDGAYKVL